MGRVSGKVAIVTGASSGMGKADAQMLASEGAKVVLADLDDAQGQLVAEKIGANALYLHLDVTDEENWKSVVAETVAAFGGAERRRLYY